MPIDQRRRYLVIWRRQKRKLHVCRIVVTSQFGTITTPRSRMLARDASFFRVISTASLWDLHLWRQWGEVM